MEITFEQLVTPAGTVIAGGLVTAVVELLKAAIPGLDARVSGALQAFVLTAVLYAIVAAVVAPAEADGYLGIFAAWLATATTAVGVKSVAVHVTGESSAIDTP